MTSSGNVGCADWVCLYGEDPYIVSLCFGYDAEALYFRSTPGGRKIDILIEGGVESWERI
jgi:nitroimidazol reductase NimA-like FMN-containing flavoprotein (pyridoxamine 5'-phosphate oxidase superfamily)